MSHAALPSRARSARSSRAASTAPAARPRLHVVNNPQATTSGAGFVMLCLTLLAAGLIAVLMLNTARAQQQFTLDSLQAESGRLSGQQQELNTDLDSLSAPQQIALAAQKLGLTKAGKVRWVDAHGKTLRVSSSGAGGDSFTVGTLPTTPGSKIAGSALSAAGTAIKEAIPPSATPTAKPSATATTAPSPAPTMSSQPSAPKSSASAKPKATTTPSPTPTR